MKVINKTKNTIICENSGWADTLYTRAKGLLGRNSLAENEGLVITGCRSIHSFFMQFPICAIFIDKNNRVVKVLESFKVNRLSGYYFTANKVIELPPWKAKNTSTNVGDIIEFEK